MTVLSHRIALDPTRTQEEAFRRACGVSRFTYNWIVAECRCYYDEYSIPPSLMALKKRWNREKPAWVMESPRDANSQPFVEVGKAYASFYRTLKTGKRAHPPQFKKKGKCRDAFYVANDKFAVTEKFVRLPVIGTVKMREELRFTGKILHGTVSREADRWFLSVAVEGNFPRERTGDEVVGVDLGVKALATLSTGEVITGPKPLKAALKRLQRQQRWHSRKVKGSKNRAKSAMKLSRLHARVAHIRQDAIHKLTSKLCRENQAVVIEDLNVAGMVKNHHLAKAISDMGFGEFRRQLEYKGKLYGTELVVANRWYPSSKTCSCCGHVIVSLALSDREYRCSACGVVIDRDLNAAVNLRTLGLRGTSPSGGTPVDIAALAPIRRGETAMSEAGTFWADSLSLT